jgi:hypothetical protein
MRGRRSKEFCKFCYGGHNASDCPVMRNKDINQ